MNEKDVSMIPNVISVRERLRLRASETDKFKAGFLSVSAVLPIREDAYMTTLLLAVLLRGSEKYKTVAAINRRLDELYGTEISLRNHYCGALHVIGLCADVLGAEYLPSNESVLDEAIDVMRELLFHPLLDENGLLQAHYVESEKKLQCDSIRAQRNNPHTYAVERAAALVYEGTPLAHPILGDEARVMAVTPEALTAHWRRIVKEISLDCFFVGSECPTRVAAALDAAFGKELSDSEAAWHAPLPERRPERDTRRAEDALAITQSHLIMVYNGGVMLCDEALYAVIVFNEILGGSPVSKLFMNVRERLGLCYSCHSAYNAYRGTLTVSCGLADASMELAEREIGAQIAAIAEGHVTDAEWEAAKRSLCNAYRQMEDSPVSMERFFFGRSLCGVSRSLSDCRRAIEAVTREEVAAFARTLRLDTVFSLHATEDGEVNDDEED